MKVSETIETVEEPKNKQVFAYPTSEEYRRLKEYADRTRRTMSQALLSLALAKLDEEEGK